MGKVVVDAEEVGYRCSDIRTILLCVGAGSSSVWFVDVGYTPTHWEDYGRLSPQGGMDVERAAAE